MCNSKMKEKRKLHPLGKNFTSKNLLGSPVEAMDIRVHICFCVHHVGEILFANKPAITIYTTLLLHGVS